MERRTRLVLIASGIVAIMVAAAVLVFNAGSVFHFGSDISIIPFDTDSAAGHVRELVQWGPRMTGTDAELNGARYIMDRFREVGLSDVHMENMTVPMFEVQRASLSMVQYMPLGNLPRPGASPMEVQHITEFVVQGFSGSYIWRDFRDDLELVNIGDGSDTARFMTASGKACFVEQSEKTPSNWEIYGYASDAGVKVLILQNIFQGEELGYLPFFKSGPDLGTSRIPVLMVGKDAGDRMLQNPTWKVRLFLDVIIEDRPVRAVVGDIKGRTDEMFIFTAHHDTCYNTVGAIDNTVGPATLIEIARSIVETGRTFSRTIRFATFGGEEEGLFGCIEYYEAHREELSRNCHTVLNFDMAHVDVRSNRAPLSCNDNSTIEKVLSYRDRLLEVEPGLKSYEITASYWDMSSASSDYWPFVNGGARGLAAWGSGCYEYHTYKDDMSHLNPESLQIWGRILGSFAADECD